LFDKCGLRLDRVISKFDHFSIELLKNFVLSQLKALLLVPGSTAPRESVKEKFCVLGYNFGVLVDPVNVVWVPIRRVRHAELKVLKERHVLQKDDIFIFFGLSVSAAHEVLDSKSHIQLLLRGQIWNSLPTLLRCSTVVVLGDSVQQILYFELDGNVLTNLPASRPCQILVHDAHSHGNRFERPFSPYSDLFLSFSVDSNNACLYI